MIEKNAIVGAVFAGSLILVPQAGHATDFYFDGYGGFTDPDEQSQIDAGLPTSGWPDPLVWAVPNTFDTDVTAFHAFGWDSNLADHSHLSINETTPDLPPGMSNYENVVQDQITVSSDIGSVIGWLTHHNEVVSEAFGPDYVGIHYHLDIYSDPSRMDIVWSSGPADFTLEMLETFNRADPGQCPGGFDELCPDRLRFALGLTTDPDDFGDSFDEVVGSFKYMDRWYKVSLNGFWDDDPELIGTAWSEEGDHNTFDVRAQIHLPEPGVGLLGMGLVALGLAVYRRGGSAPSA